MLEDVPADLKGKDDMKGEASLKGHLANGDEDTSASQAYVPPDEKDDKQLKAAIGLLNGVKPAETASADSDAAKANVEAGKAAGSTPPAPSDSAKPN